MVLHGLYLFRAWQVCERAKILVREAQCFGNRHNGLLVACECEHNFSNGGCLVSSVSLEKIARLARGLILRGWGRPLGWINHNVGRAVGLIGEEHFRRLSFSRSIQLRFVNSFLANSLSPYLLHHNPPPFNEGLRSYFATSCFVILFRASQMCGEEIL